MKKQLLNLSLSTALSTALLTTFLPTTTLQASNASSSDVGLVVEEDVVVEKVVAKVNPFLVTSHVGIAIDETTLPSSDQYVIHSDILSALEKHLTLTVVYFENDQAYFNYDLATEDEEAELRYDLKAGKSLSQSEERVIAALVKPLELWVARRNDFIKRYFQYRTDARDVTLLKAVNGRYNSRKLSFGRPEALDTALDGTCVRTMNQIIRQTKKDALRSIPLIASDFDTKRDKLWIALAAATLHPDDYSDEVSSGVEENALKQLAFEGTHDGLIFTNEDFASLIANLTSADHQLPTSPNTTYQSLVGAEAILAMAMYQRSLVNPDSVDELFSLNAKALLVEQKAFAESAIRNERSHRLLATDLVPVEMLRAQDRLLAKVELTDDEADAYGDAGSDRGKKAEIIESARARILKEGRDAARETTGVPELTDKEADDWNWYKARERVSNMEGVVEAAKARLARIEKEKVDALLLKRTQARTAGGVEFTDEEADNYVNAEVEGKPGIVELAKARIVKEAETAAAALLLKRTQARDESGVVLTDEEADLYLTGEKEAALKAAAERLSPAKEEPKVSDE
ncbi:MAG TPA: hypothetical protein DD412_06245 [Holosporales bacterium]|nr:hypothetical protein [Holosporales bacterium]